MHAICGWCTRLLFTSQVACKNTYTARTNGAGRAFTPQFSPGPHPLCGSPRAPVCCWPPLLHNLSFNVCLLSFAAARRASDGTWESNLRGGPGSSDGGSTRRGSSSGSLSPTSRVRSVSASRRSVLGPISEAGVTDDDDASDRPPSPRRMGTYSKELVERALARQERRATVVGAALQLVGGIAFYVH